MRGVSMDIEKIGNFIALLRKRKGLKQAELAEKLDITSNAVSKWERGLCMPDVSKLDSVAEILGVSVIELIKGEEIEKLNDAQINQIAKKGILFYSSKLASSFKKKLIIICSVFLVAMFAISLLFVISNYGKFKVYNLYSPNDEYTADGNVILTNTNNIFTLTNIEALDEQLYLVEGYAFEYGVYLDEQLLVKQGDIYLYQHDENDNPIYLTDYLDDISIYVSDELDKNKSINVGKISKKQLKLVINYVDNELNFDTYTLIFNLNQSFSNNKILYNK